jgi:hypothetical protein
MMFFFLPNEAYISFHSRSAAQPGPTVSMAHARMAKAERGVNAEGHFVDAAGRQPGA